MVINVRLSACVCVSCAEDMNTLVHSWTLSMWLDKLLRHLLIAKWPKANCRGA